MAKNPLFRWLQFGVLDLLILTTIVAIVLGLWRNPNIATWYEPLVEGTTPGQHWAGNGLRMRFRWCPPGEFKMGSPQDERDRGADEDQVSATLSCGFWLGKCEVTQGEYRQVMNDAPAFFRARSARRPWRPESTWTGCRSRSCRGTTPWSSASASPSRSARPAGCGPVGNIACRPKRSGNTPVGPER